MPWRLLRKPVACRANRVQLDRLQIIQELDWQPFSDHDPIMRPAPLSGAFF